MSYTLISSDSEILTNGLTEYVVEVDSETKERMIFQLPKDKTIEDLTPEIDRTLEAKKAYEEMEKKKEEDDAKAKELREAEATTEEES